MLILGAPYKTDLPFVNASDLALITDHAVFASDSSPEAMDCRHNGAFDALRHFWQYAFSESNSVSDTNTFPEAEPLADNDQVWFRTLPRQLDCLPRRARGRLVAPTSRYGISRRFNHGFNRLCTHSIWGYIYKFH